MKKPFKMTARVLAHLGEDLIKDESIALLELVKNSYDAGATKCVVDFNFDIFGSLIEISISDNGSGMSLDTIENIWLVIGTDNKKNRLISHRQGRLPLGEKGIGRLGVHKLGNDIKLYSKHSDENEVYVSIDWSKLAESKDIDDFKIDYGYSSDSHFFDKQTGTKIIVRNLKGEWNRRKLRSVFRDLTTLNSPFSEKSDSFEVVVSSNSNVFSGLPNLEAIKNAGLYYGHCTLEGSIITEFSYEFKPWNVLDKIKSRSLTALDEYEKVLIHNVEVETETGKVVKREKRLDLNEYNIGRVQFDVIMYEKDSSVFSLLNIEKKGLNDYLKENSGIRVYRDNMRVFDYGEPGNDWLSIDKRRLSRSGGSISNSLLLGSVMLDRISSYGLREKTNREGFIEDEAYFAFVDAISYVMDLFIQQRNQDRMNLMSIYKTGKNVTEPVIGDLSEVISIVKEKVPEEKDQHQILTYLYRIESQYNEVRDTLIHSASIGINLGGAIHELEKQMAALKSCAEAGNIFKVKEIIPVLETIIANYSSMMLKSEIQKINVSQIVGKVIEYNRFRFQDHAIRLFSNYKKVDFMAKLSKTETISALTNLVDNSIYWVCRSRIEDRMIYLYVTESFREGFVTVAVCDNGPGFKIAPELAVRAFVSGKPLNAGMGFGLYITHETMKQLNGHMDILSNCDIELPSKIVDKGIDKAIVALSFPKA
ncbi:sensor histidine kinase [Prevotella sp.]